MSRKSVNRQRLSLIALFLMTSLVGACGDSSKIEGAIRENLKDPVSANFKDVVFSPDNKRACVEWNAKNSMGGYGSWSIAELTKYDSDWIVKDMKGSDRNCTEIGFEALDAEEKARGDAFDKAIEILQKARNVSASEAFGIALNGQCSALVEEYMREAGLVANYRVFATRDKALKLPAESTTSYSILQISEENLMKVQKKLDTGNCA